MIPWGIGSNDKPGRLWIFAAENGEEDDNRMELEIYENLKYENRSLLQL